MNAATPLPRVVVDVGHLQDPAAATAPPARTVSALARALHRVGAPVTAFGATPLLPPPSLPHDLAGTWPVPPLTQASLRALCADGHVVLHLHAPVARTEGRLPLDAWYLPLVLDGTVSLSVSVQPGCDLSHAEQLLVGAADVRVFVPDPSADHDERVWDRFADSLVEAWAELPTPGAASPSPLRLGVVAGDAPAAVRVAEGLVRDLATVPSVAVTPFVPSGTVPRLHGPLLGHVPQESLGRATSPTAFDLLLQVTPTPAFPCVATPLPATALPTAPAIRNTPPQPGTVLVIGAVSPRDWPLAYLRVDPGHPVHVFSAVTWDGAPWTWYPPVWTAEGDEVWRRLLHEAAVVVDLGDAGSEPTDGTAPARLVACQEALAAGVPVVVMGDTHPGFGDEVVHRLPADVDDHSFIAVVRGLSRPSPMRRARLAAVRRHSARGWLERTIAGGPVEPAPPPRITSGLYDTGPRWRICRADDMDDVRFADWAVRLGDTARFSRKLWEFVAIAETLRSLGLLSPGHRGLGFGCGLEPLPAAFAAMGCEILATDLDPEREEAQAWGATGQLTGSLDALNAKGLCPPPAFDRLVSYRDVDMCAIPDELTGFDFCWSACAFEHLGSIDAGLDFVERSLACLRPGGWAVHTSELLLSAEDETIEDGPTVVFRERDLRGFADRMRAAGHHVPPVDLAYGHQPLDHTVDLPPFTHDPHLKLAIGTVVSTSVLVAVRRGVR